MILLLRAAFVHFSMLKFIRTILGVAALHVAGCAGSDSIDRIDAPAAMFGHIELPESASVTDGILAGFDVAAQRDDWRIGDRVLLGIRSIKPDATITRYLLIELGDQLTTGKVNFDSKGRERPFRFSSEVAKTNLTVFDDTGRKIDSANGRFAINLLGFGPFDAVNHALDQPEPRSFRDLGNNLNDADFERTMRGWFTLFAFSGSMNKRGVFSSMMRDVVARPSLLRMILKPRAEMTFGDDRWSVRGADWTTNTGKLSTITIPLQLRIADKPALQGEMLAVEPVAPLSLCGGLVRAHAVNPTDSRHRVDLWLIATARGTGGTSFAPAETAK